MRSLTVPVDLSDRDRAEAMVDRTVEAFGRLDVLVNNAAVTLVGDLDAVRCRPPTRSRASSPPTENVYLPEG